jgi:hypothetical protein
MAGFEMVVPVQPILDDAITYQRWFIIDRIKNQRGAIVSIHLALHDIAALMEMLGIICIIICYNCAAILVPNN